MKKNIYEIPCEYVWAYERESMLDPELVEEECEEWFETFITDEAEYEYGLRIHVRGALEHGATEEEILEALELSSVVGYHAMTVHLPAFEEEVQKFKGS